MNKKLLLTGHQGFIASHVNRIANDLGYHLIGHEKDDAGLLEKLDSVDAVLHLGAITDTLLTDVNAIMDANAQFSHDLFHECKQRQLKVIFASSASIYGNQQGKPGTPYSWSKWVGEAIGNAMIPDLFTPLRYFNVYGPGEDHKGVMASVVNQAFHKGSMQLFPGKPKRDFIHVTDVARATLAALNAPCGTYEVGTGEASLFETMLDIANIPYTYHNESAVPPWLQFHTCADPNRWVPGWQPAISLAEGVKSYMGYLKGNSVQ